MSGYRFLLASLGLLSACELSFDPSLDGKRCDSEGACVSGYVCSPLGICEREGPRNVSRSATAVADAGIEIEAGTGDAASVLDAAEPQTSVPATSTNEDDNVVDVTPDSGTAVADAGQVGADADADAAAPQGTMPDGTDTTTDRGADAAIPPPPTMTTPAVPQAPTPPPSPGGGEGAPPPPGMMSQPPGPTHGCSAGRAKCGDECVDLEDDKDHCGACNNTCRKTESCDNGTCKKSAP